jgi:hypothetical protein
MGCMCNKNKKDQDTNNQEQINNLVIENKKPQENINNLVIQNKKVQENINNLNKSFKKEKFIDFTNFLSNYWIYIVIVILILIGILYYVFLRQNNYQEFILAPPGHIRGRLDDYNVEL